MRKLRKGRSGDSREIKDRGCGVVIGLFFLLKKGHIQQIPHFELSSMTLSLWGFCLLVLGLGFQFFVFLFYCMGFDFDP